MIDSFRTQRDRGSSESSTVFVPVQMDVFAELLGGRPLKEILRASGKSGFSANMAARLRVSGGQYGPDDGYFFREDPDSRLCTEVLFLKTALFFKLISRFKKQYSVQPGPCLTLNPEDIYIMFSPGESFPVPAKWNFNIQELRSPLSLKIETASSADLFQPAGEVSDYYSAPEISSIPFAAEKRADFVITRMERDAGDPSSLRLTMKLSGKGLKYSEYLKGDLVQIFLKCNDTEINDLTFWGIVREDPSNSFELAASHHDPERKIETTLSQRVGSTFFETKATLYKRFSASCDIYTLGKVFLKILLANDRVPLFLLQEKVECVVSVMDDSFRGVPSDISFIENRLFAKLNEFETVFSKKNILYCHDERSERENRIPDDIWREIMLLCFRMVTDIDGFSLCPRKADITKEAAESACDALISGVARLSDILRTELFFNRAQSVEILEVLEMCRA